MQKVFKLNIFKKSTEFESAKYVGREENLTKFYHFLLTLLDAEVWSTPDPKNGFRKEKPMINQTTLVSKNQQHEFHP